jgi:hypothetical protein
LPNDQSFDNEQHVQENGQLVQRKEYLTNRVRGSSSYRDEAFKESLMKDQNLVIQRNNALLNQSLQKKMNIGNDAISSEQYTNRSGNGTDRCLSRRQNVIQSILEESDADEDKPIPNHTRQGSMPFEVEK